jgi:putative aldouronate transport system permease protein
MAAKTISAETKGKRRRRRWTRDDIELTTLALPTTVWYLLFAYLPMFGIIIAFKNFRINGNFVKSIFTSKWVGFENFRFMFTSKDAWIVLRNTLGYNIIFIILGIVVPVTLALMISQLHSRRLAKVYQTAMFMPYFLSWIVVSAVLWAFLSYDKGIANALIQGRGGEPVNWYMEKSYWPFFIVFLNLWKGLGYGMVVYLATITGIDPSYYEAAVIDGATKWQQMRYITLPMMRTVLAIMFILSVGRIFYSDFGLFYQVPRDSNSLFTVTYTLDVMVYKSLKSATVGMASAAAFFQSVMGCITTLAANAVVKRIDPDSAMI